MIKDYFKFTGEIVTATYEKLINNGLPFLQIFQQIFQDTNIAKTYTLLIFKKLHSRFVYIGLV